MARVIYDTKDVQEAYLESKGDIDIFLTILDDKGTKITGKKDKHYERAIECLDELKEMVKALPTA